MVIQSMPDAIQQWFHRIIVEPQVAHTCIVQAVRKARQEDYQEFKTTE